MKKLFLLLIVPLLSLSQEINYLKISNPSFVSGMYKGELVDAFQWNDKLGNNILILCEETKPTGEFMGEYNPPLEYHYKTIYGFHYVIKNLSNRDLEVDLVKLWDIKEGITLSDGEAGISFDKEATKITDLDNDNIAEVSLGYRIFPDVTDCCYPHGIKLIMHEKGYKYAIRGSTIVQWIDQESYESTIEGGKKVMYGRNSFEDAPKVFIDFASELFDTVLMKTYKMYD